METLISVIIPTYEGHHKYVQQAINSVDFEDSEIIVVNDSLVPLEAEGVTVINRTEEPKWGTGKARNLGAIEAKGVLLWLDADDVLIPGAMQLLWNAWIESISEANPYGNIIYGDLIRSDTNYYWRVKDQYCGPDLRKSGLITSNRPYCCLIAKENHDLVGGYDELMPTYEDIDYEKKTTVAGMCETHLNAAIYWYRWDSGERRNLAKDEEVKRAVSDYMYNKYRRFHTGEIKLSNCRTCGDQPISPYNKNAGAQNLVRSVPQPDSNEVQFLVYIGGEPTHSERGPVTGLEYRVGGDRRHAKKRIVDHMTPGPDEIARADVNELVKRRIHNRDQFKLQVEIVVGETRPKPQVSKPVQMQPTPQPDVNMDFFFEDDPIGNYSVNAIKKKIAEDDVPRSQLQLWLEEEQRSVKPRIGMIAELKNAIG